jgi:hypothetical protein
VGDSFFEHILLILLKAVLLAKRSFGLLILMGEVVLPPWAEVDMPAPETPDEGLGVLVILGPERAVGTGVILVCHGFRVFKP